MSRIGKNKVNIPNSVTVTLDGNTISVKGPKGLLTREISPLIEVSIEGDTLSAHLRNESRQAHMSWGTTTSHIQSMIIGVCDGYSKKLLINGVGYKAQVQGSSLTLTVGFSHTVPMDIPEGITVKTEKGVITVSGIDKQKVGQFAAEIRDVKRTEPYKGHGIRYEGEYVIRKQGKKAKTS